MSYPHDCNDCQPMPVIQCNPLTTDDINYVGNPDSCIPLTFNEKLTSALNKIVTYLKNRLFGIVSNSLVVTAINNNCDKYQRIELVPSTDVGNSLILGTDGYPYVPPSVAPLVVTTADTATVDLSPGVNPITANVKISANAGNSITANADGIYAPTPAATIDYSANNGLKENPANNFKLGGPLIENTVIDASAFYLNILNNVNIGITSPLTTSKPRLKVARNISTINDEAVGSTSWSELYTANLGSLGTVGDYAGIFGSIAVESTAAESTNLSYSFAGIKGAVVVNTDNAIDAFLSSFSGGGSFQSYTVGGYLTHGKLAKFAVYRAVGPKQITSTSTQEFGGITDCYGLYIESMSGNIPARITRVWGVYQEDVLDKNWMASTLKVGGSNTIEVSAQLEVNSTTKGSIPFPVMTEAQRLAIATPALGLHVYQSDLIEGVYVNKSSGWTFAY